MNLNKSYGHCKILNPHLEFGFEDNYDSLVYFAKLFLRNKYKNKMKTFGKLQNILHAKKTMTTGTQS